MERLNLNETHLHQEPNTPEENYQVPKPELDFKGLVEQMAAAALQRDSDTQTTEKVSDSDHTTPPTQVSNEKSCQHSHQPLKNRYKATNQAPDHQRQQLPRYTQL